MKINNYIVKETEKLANEINEWVLKTKPDFIYIPKHYYPIIKTYLSTKVKSKVTHRATSAGTLTGIYQFNRKSFRNGKFGGMLQYRNNEFDIDRDYLKDNSFMKLYLILIYKYKSADLDLVKHFTKIFKGEVNVALAELCRWGSQNNEVYKCKLIQHCLHIALINEKLLTEQDVLNWYATGFRKTDNTEKFVSNLLQNHNLITSNILLLQYNEIHGALSTDAHILFTTKLKNYKIKVSFTHTEDGENFKVSAYSNRNPQSFNDIKLNDSGLTLIEMLHMDDFGFKSIDVSKYVTKTRK